MKIRRREFITLLGGAAAAWPLAARAQQPREPMRRIGVLIQTTPDDPTAPVRVAMLSQGLQELGWRVGGNIQIDYRYGAGNSDRFPRLAAEMVALAPDVIVAGGGTFVGALQRVTRTVPIVFVQVTDPVGSGRVASLARPGGNATGFSGIEYGMSGKWLELLKQIAPGVTRVAVLRDASVIAGSGQFGAIQGAAPSFRVEVSPVDVRDPSEIERVVTAFARTSNGGLIVVSNAAAGVNRHLIIELAARHRLPAAYNSRQYVDDGGLISYGAVTMDQWRRAAGYVDRILKGEKPADLPVQAPTKYETVLNMKTARALGLQVPDIVLLRADEVLE